MGIVNLAHLLGFAPQHIYYVVKNADGFYRTITIPKKRGGSRTIDMPLSELKGIQKQIDVCLLKDIKINNCVHSYVRGRSVITAARLLCGNRAILAMDIKDFFHSISARRIFGLFKSLGHDNKESYILTKLTTKDNRLGQGSPCSPAISNLILRNFDENILKILEKWEMDYVRYSDNLFFIHRKNFNHERLRVIVSNMLIEHGFEVNTEKTTYHPRGHPRITLGLLSHGENLALPGPVRKKYRALFHKASTNIAWGQYNREKLKGIMEWYKAVYGKDDTYRYYNKIYKNIIHLKIHKEYRSE